MLKQLNITNLNVWERFFCPVCFGRTFVSIHNSEVYCDDCNAKFVVRNTCGDPGYCVDCYTESCHNIVINGRTRQEINYREMAKERVPGGYAYLIDKEDDYNSGWIASAKSSYSSTVYLQEVNEQILEESGGPGTETKWRFKTELIPANCYVLAEYEYFNISKVDGLFKVRKATEDILYLYNNGEELQLKANICGRDGWRLRGITNRKEFMD